MATEIQETNEPATCNTNDRRPFPRSGPAKRRSRMSFR